MVMILKFIFNRLSQSSQAKFMTKRGIVLGTRNKGGRLIYIYMVNNLFAEIAYENDNPRNKVESLVVIDGLRKLNKYLENDIRSIA
jgi:hypothetical protein